MVVGNREAGGRERCEARATLGQMARRKTPRGLRRVRLKVGAFEGGAGEARGAKQCSVSFQLAPRIAANWKQMLMISVECPPATLGLVLWAGASWKHAHHWAASPPLARQPHPLLVRPSYIKWCYGTCPGCIGRGKASAWPIPLRTSGFAIPSE